MALITLEDMKHIENYYHSHAVIGELVEWYCSPYESPGIGQIVTLGGIHWVQVSDVCRYGADLNDVVSGVVVGYRVPQPGTVYPLPFVR